MNISGIDFPKPLLDAWRGNQLVLFTGAGVSIPQPAGLPTFRQLAKLVALGSGVTLEKGEPEDRFLGGLAHRGQQVHTRAAEVLREKSPKPSCLHHDLTALNRNPESLRIVTTNFDTLFEDAAKEKFEGLPEVFRAPALPQGGDFNGIVHVHGSIDSPKDMVLTDIDFGRAYLTEGWARIFLLDLFRTFTVLFVGYGHNDTVMNYLARALPSGQTRPRFVLTDETDQDRWDALGIRPVIFPKPDKHDYRGLYEGVSGLSEYATRGILGWQSAITQIAASPPSLDQEEMDLVEDGLSDPARTRFFTEAASQIEWIPWLDEKGHLESLFGTDSPTILEEPPRILGWWLAHTFIKDHPDEMFRIIAKHGMNLHPEFWGILMHGVTSQEDPPWEAKTLARWVSLLLVSVPPRPNGYALLWLGECCIKADLSDSLLEVFRQMSAVRTSIKERITFSMDDPTPPTTAEVVQVHEHYELNELWEKGLKPNLNNLAEPLLSQLVDSFTTKHRTLCAWQAAGRDWDPESYGRSAIDPQEQDAYPQSVDVLIDAARDSLEHLVATQPEIAAPWCDQLIRSDVPILRRLALHALTLRSDLTPNTKIDWVVEKIGLHDLSAHHELFQVMGAVYPHATEEQRGAIIEEVSKFDLPGHDGEDIARTIAYQHFTWFAWLKDSDPECGLAQKRLEDILGQYPEFKPRTWANLNRHRSFGFVQHRSPWSTEELLSKPAKEWVDKLLAFQNPNEFEQDPYDRIGVSHTIEEAATKDFPWGIELADALTQSENWNTDLWPPLMKSWAHQQGEEEQTQVFNRLLRSELQKQHVRTIAETLMTMIKEGNLSYRSGLLSKANQIATTSWDNLNENEPVSNVEDWYSRAINHSAGILAEFWMQSISSWHKEQDSRPERISDEYMEFMHKIVEDETPVGRLGKAAITRQFRFLTAVDEEWVIEHLIPLFDSENKDDRLAAWEGFLYEGISPRVSDILEKPFLRALSALDDLFPTGSKFRELFIRQFTTLVIYFVDQPLNSWVPMFFTRAEVEDRRTFALIIAHHLHDMETGPQQDLWDRWLRKYWENRLQGTPAPLDPSEAVPLFYWLVHLHDLFPEAVDLAVKIPNLPSKYSPPIHALINKGAAERHPEATAKLLIYWADQHLPRPAWRGSNELIANLLNQDLSEGLRHQLKEMQAEFGL